MIRLYQPLNIIGMVYREIRQGLRDLAGDGVQHGLQRERRRLAVPLVTRGQRVDEL